MKKTLRKDGVVDYQRLYGGLAAIRNRGKQKQLLLPGEWVKNYVFTSDEVERVLADGETGQNLERRMKIRAALRRSINEGYLASNEPGQTKRDIRLTQKGIVEYGRLRLVPTDGTDGESTLQSVV